MSALKIIFLCSGDQICRCMIAKHILQSFDRKLEVYAAGLPPIIELTEEQNKAIAKLGFGIGDDKIKTLDEYKDIDFEYLITVSHNISDQLKKYPRNYKLKLHMEFTDFCNGQSTESETIELYKNIRDEVENELGYFYYHILNKDED